MIVFGKRHVQRLVMQDRVTTARPLATSQKLKKTVRYL